MRTTNRGIFTQLGHCVVHILDQHLLTLLVIFMCCHGNWVIDSLRKYDGVADNFCYRVYDTIKVQAAKKINFINC